MEARAADLERACTGRDEVEAAIDRTVWYAGWADKLAQVLGSSNPVAGPYFDFTIPEPTGVVAILAPARAAAARPRLPDAACARRRKHGRRGRGQPRIRSPPSSSPRRSPPRTSRPGRSTSSPASRTSSRPWLAGHMDVNAIDLTGIDGADGRARASGCRERQARRSLVGRRAEPVGDRRPSSSSRPSGTRSGSDGLRLSRASRRRPAGSSSRPARSRAPTRRAAGRSRSAPRCSRRASARRSCSASSRAASSAQRADAARPTPPERPRLDELDVHARRASTACTRSRRGPLPGRCRSRAARASRPRVTAAGALHCSAVGRRRHEDGVRRRAGRLAVVPGRPDPPRRVDVGGRQRERAEPANAASAVDVRDANGGAPRGAAVRRASTLRSRTAPSPRGRRRRARRSAGSPGRPRRPAARRCRRRADQVSPPSSDQLTASMSLVGRVRVDEVAAPVERRRRGVVARDPVLVEGDSLVAAHAALLGARRARRSTSTPSGERLIASRVTPSPRASVEMSHVPCAASYATTGSLARSLTPGRHARVGQPGQEPAAPGRAVVRRDGEADVRRPAVEAAADLERRDRRPAEREAVRLDLGLVLRVGRSRTDRARAGGRRARSRARPCP